MIIAGVYSFNRSEDIITSRYSAEFGEVRQVIAAVDSAQCKTKASREKTMPGRILYHPRALNKAFTREFELRGWEKYRVRCEYSTSIIYLASPPIIYPKGLFVRWISSRNA